MTAAEAMASLTQFEREVCLRWNRLRSKIVLYGLVFTSRAGDGGVWAALVLLLLAWHGGSVVWPVFLRLALALCLCFPAYRLLKRGLARARPFAAEDGVVAWTTPPDQYAFPSGHTMHAVAFSIVLCEAFPELVFLLLPFTAVLAISRVALGMHYPSDVIAGGILGALAGWAIVQLTF